MKTVEKYRITVAVLCSIIFLQWVYFSLKAKPTVKPLRPLQAAGKIAIVIDDWGYNLDNISLLKELSFPLTVSILPHLRYSREIAQDAQRLGLEVILHLPMEPHEKFRLEENTIITSMSEAQIRDIIEADLENIAVAKGVNNHMGSKATEDYPTMNKVLGALKEKHIFFLDSLVTRKSICARVAKTLKLPFVKRDVFLDNKEDPEYIKQQLYQLKRKASAYGYAVGIGHDRTLTLRVLKAVLPEFVKQGFTLVFLSEVAR